MSITTVSKTNKRAIGRAGEDAACAYLENRGYRILYRNFRFGRYGEIDIIATNYDALCFIEVKSRACAGYGTPAESVGYAKRRNIIAVAYHFLRTFDFRDYKPRFDVMEVICEKSGALRPIKEIRHIEDAFLEV